MSERIFIPKNLPIPHRVAVLPYHVIGVALNGVEPAVFHPFHDIYMVSDEGIFAAGKDSYTRFSAVTRFHYSRRMLFHYI